MSQRVEGPEQALHRARVSTAVLLAPGGGAPGRPAAGPRRLPEGIHGAPAERGRGRKGGGVGAAREAPVALAGGAVARASWRWREEEGGGWLRLFVFKGGFGLQKQIRDYNNK